MLIIKRGFKSDTLYHEEGVCFQQATPGSDDPSHWYVPPVQQANSKTPIENVKRKHKIKGEKNKRETTER